MISFGFCSLATSRDIGAILRHFPFFWQYAQLRTKALAGCHHSLGQLSPGQFPMISCDSIRNRAAVDMTGAFRRVVFPGNRKNAAVVDCHRLLLLFCAELVPTFFVQKSFSDIFLSGRGTL